MKQKIIYGSCIAAIIILIVVSCTTRSWYLEGWWRADHEFLERAGLDGLLVCIGPGGLSGRLAHVIVYSNEEIVLNKTYKISLFHTSPYRYRAKLYDADGEELEEEEIFPDSFYITIDTSMHSMVFSTWEDDGKETVHAYMFKDNELTLRYRWAK